MEFSIVEACWDYAPWGAADVLVTTLLGGAVGWAATWQVVRPARTPGMLSLRRPTR